MVEANLGQENSGVDVVATLGRPNFEHMIHFSMIRLDSHKKQEELKDAKFLLHTMHINTYDSESK